MPVRKLRPGGVPDPPYEDRREAALPTPPASLQGRGQHVYQTESPALCPSGAVMAESSVFFTCDVQDRDRNRANPPPGIFCCISSIFPNSRPLQGKQKGARDPPLAAEYGGAHRPSLGQLPAPESICFGEAS